MKPIHYILICCLLGVVGCSKEEETCNCVVTQYHPNISGTIIVRTRNETLDMKNGKKCIEFELKPDAGATYECVVR